MLKAVAGHWDLLLVAAVVLVCQVGLFYLHAWRCQLLQHHQSSDSLLVLVVTDVHMLGKRRRSWIERWWVDWQVWASVRAAVDVHRPDVALVLGDQFDEGGPWTSNSDWNEYAVRFFRAVARLLPLKTLYLRLMGPQMYIWSNLRNVSKQVGNHDAAFGRDLQPKDLVRFEDTFGAANRIEESGGHVFVSLNTMALDSDVTRKAVQVEARNFFESINASELRAHADGRVVLLTHLPLFRADDLQCGEARRAESGHVTYEHPGFAYAEHHHVLSRELSAELLSKLQPDLVLSGHTHAWCAYQHPNAKAMEYTVPAFSWGQRPDPSYALLQLPRSGHDHRPKVSACHLPHESFVFATYAVTLLLVLLVRAVRCVRTLQTSTAKAKGA